MSIGARLTKLEQAAQQQAAPPSPALRELCRLAGIAYEPRMRALDVLQIVAAKNRKVEGLTAVELELLGRVERDGAQALSDDELRAAVVAGQKLEPPMVYGSHGSGALPRCECWLCSHCRVYSAVRRPK